MNILHELATLRTKSQLIKLILTEGEVFEHLIMGGRRTKEIRNRLERMKH